MGIDNLVFRLVGITRRVGKPNGNMLVELVKLFSKAESRIKVVSGELPYEVYCNNGLVEVMQQALKKGCTIEIIAGPSAERESLEFFSSHGISVYVLEEWPSRHFAVVDGKHVRLEEPHQQGAKERVQYIIYNFKDATELENKFDTLRQQARHWKQ